MTPDHRRPGWLSRGPGTSTHPECAQSLAVFGLNGIPFALPSALEMTVSHVTGLVTKGAVSVVKGNFMVLVTNLGIFFSFVLGAFTAGLFAEVWGCGRSPAPGGAQAPFTRPPQ